MIDRTIKTVVAFLLVFIACKKASNPYEPGDRHVGSWKLVYESAGDKYYWDMYFTDQYNGWVVGDSGSAVYSDDQGLTWQPQQTGTSNDLSSIHFIDQYTGWIVGDSSTVLKTTNGGQDWIQMAFPDTLRCTLRSVYFIDPNNGYISGHIFDNTNVDIDYIGAGGIWHTTDSGQSWTFQESGSEWLITTIHFFDQYEGRAITTGNEALRTSNGGIDWDIIPIPTQVDSFAVVTSVLFFINEDKGWVSGLNPAGPTASLPIYYTDDGGMHWKPQAFFSNGIMINTIFFVDEYKGWAGSNNGIYYTVNGGDIWSIQYEAVFINDIHFVSAEHGWALSIRGDVFQYSL